MLIRFVVTGRPNKGKSSLVATLAQDERLEIGSLAGTTRHCERHAVRVGDSGYVLVDTPGLQRPGKVLRWLQAHATAIGAGANRRREVLEAFIAHGENRARFPEEIEILEAILHEEGTDSVSALIYVVDSSVPFERGYEDEMAILQWCGLLSVAVINPITSSEFAADWQRALAQYFRLVRTVNAKYASAGEQLALLEDLARLEPRWRAPLESVVAALRAQRRERAQRAAAVAAGLLERLGSLALSRRFGERADAEAAQGELTKRFREEVRAHERAAFDALVRIYSHGRARRDIAPLRVETDVFAVQEWTRWGLGRTRLAVAGALGGAALAAPVDAALLGHGLGIATVIGAALGGAGAWRGSDRLLRTRVLGVRAGGYEARVGPVASAAFLYAVLGRLLAVHAALRERTHANRDPLAIEDAGGEASTGIVERALEDLDPGAGRRLHAAFARLRKGRVVEDLYEILLPLFDPAE